MSNAPLPSDQKVRPILFSAPMVRALLSGRKTQTRRALKHQPIDILPMRVEKRGREWMTLEQREPEPKGKVVRCRYGLPGDLLWVKETHALIWPGEGPPDDIRQNKVEYRADTDGKCLPGQWPDEYRGDPDCPRWRPSIHMPRWASRLTLQITNVRVERLQAISEADARAEGVDPSTSGTSEAGPLKSYRTGFVRLWNEINGNWLNDPWVWVIEFSRIEQARAAA